MDKIDRVLAQHRRQTAIDQASQCVNEARAQLFAAMEILSDHGVEPEQRGHTCGAVRGSMSELDRALRILRRLRGNCNRAIANIARSTP